ncbi:MAG: hypothetical protein OEL87_03510 [Nanoarchaeota archaeon]|nr:hypothetical protein [Nanoarchaeota archaeon]
MDLGELAKKIGEVISGGDSVGGRVSYLRSFDNRGEGENYVFLYRFPQGSAEGDVFYDSDENIVEVDKMGCAESLLQYHLGREAAIHFFNKSKDSADIRVCYNGEELWPEQNEKDFEMVREVIKSDLY